MSDGEPGADPKEVWDAALELVEAWRKAQLAWAMGRKAAGKIRDGGVEAAAVQLAVQVLRVAFPEEVWTEESLERMKKAAAAMDPQTGNVAEIPDPLKAKA